MICVLKYTEIYGSRNVHHRFVIDPVSSHTNAQTLFLCGSKQGSVQNYGIIFQHENKETHLGCCNSLGVNPLFIDS